jgi:hypothetical protein
MKQHRNHGSQIRVSGGILFLIIGLSVWSCGIETPTKEEKKMPCDYFNRTTSSDVHSINWKDSLVLSLAYIPGSFDTIIQQSERFIIAAAREIAVIDCSTREVHRNTLPPRLSHIGPATLTYHAKIQALDGLIIYSDLDELFVFDKKLDILYSSWDQVRAMPLDFLLGASGVHVSWSHSKAYDSTELLISYQVITDVYPYYGDTLAHSVSFTR